MSGLEAIFVTIASITSKCTTRLTTPLGCVASSGPGPDSFSLAQSVVESLLRGSRGLESINCRTGQPCVYRLVFGGLRCDGPEVSVWFKQEGDCEVNAAR